MTPLIEEHDGKAVMIFRLVAGRKFAMGHREQRFIVPLSLVNDPTIQNAVQNCLLRFLHESKLTPAAVENAA